MESGGVSRYRMNVDAYEAAVAAEESLTNVVVSLSSLFHLVCIYISVFNNCFCGYITGLPVGKVSCRCDTTRSTWRCDVLKLHLYRCNIMLSFLHSPQCVVM